MNRTFIGSDREYGTSVTVQTRNHCPV